MHTPCVCVCVDYRAQYNEDVKIELKYACVRERKGTELIAKGTNYSHSDMSLIILITLRPSILTPIDKGKFYSKLTHYQHFQWCFPYLDSYFEPYRVSIRLMINFNPWIILFYRTLVLMIRWQFPNGIGNFDIILGVFQRRDDDWKRHWWLFLHHFEFEWPILKINRAVVSFFSECMLAIV